MAVSKELARAKIAELFKRRIEYSGSDFTEQDTITNFILPFLEALGWNIHDVNEVKQGGYPVKFRKTIPVKNRVTNKPDCVILWKGDPHIVLEFKRLTYGTIDRYEGIVEDLLTKAEYLKVKYAVLTRFMETAIYDGKTGKQLAKIKGSEYLDRFEELWQYLSKDRANL